MRSASANTASMSCSTSRMPYCPFMPCSSRVMRADSSGPMPAMGSSSSRRRGERASATASSSWRFSPCARSAVRTWRRSRRPTCSSQPSACALSPASRRGSDQSWKARPVLSMQDRITFSSAVYSWHSSVIWNERPRPSRARSKARSVTSRPSRWMEPESGRISPQICAISVDLPAPFGPMMAWISPARTSRSTPLVATTASKALRRPDRRSAPASP